MLPLLISLSISGVVYADATEDLFECAKSGDSMKAYGSLQAGANVDAKDSEGNTPLMYAAKEGHANVVQHLLAAKANIELKNRENLTARQLAEKAGHNDVVILIKEADPRYKTAAGDQEARAEDNRNSKQAENRPPGSTAYPPLQKAQDNALNEPNPEATESKESKAEIAAKKTRETTKQKWQKDSETVLAIIGQCRKYRETSEMSELQKEKAQKNLASEIGRINEQYSGKPIYIESARLVEVKKHKVLSAHGKKRMKAFFKELKKTEQGRMTLQMAGPNPERNFVIGMMMVSYMSGCKKCYEYTGQYLVEFDIPVPAESYEEKPYNDYQNGINGNPRNAEESENGDRKLIEVEIIKVTENEDEAMNLPKKKILTIKGKILGIEYKGRSFSEKITLVIQ